MYHSLKPIKYPTDGVDDPSADPEYLRGAGSSPPPRQHEYPSIQVWAGHWTGGSVELRLILIIRANVAEFLMTTEPRANEFHELLLFL